MNKQKNTLNKFQTNSTKYANQNWLNQQPSKSKSKQKVGNQVLVQNTNQLNVPITQRKNYKLQSKINRLILQLECTQLIDLSFSVKSLYQFGILKLFHSAEQFQKKPNDYILDQDLKKQIKFICNLWQIVKTEYISVAEFVTILKALVSNSLNYIRQVFPEENQQNLKELLENWNQIHLKPTDNSDSQTKCKSIESMDHQKTIQVQKTSASKQWEKIIIENDKKNKKKFVQTLNKTLHNTKKSISAQRINIKAEFKPKFEEYTQKDIVSRLYNYEFLRQRQRAKQIRLQQKEQEELKNCTFRPSIIRNACKDNQSHRCIKQIKGYQKTIDRLREAQQKNRQLKYMREHIPRGQNYEKIRNKGFNPPRFLNRQKHIQEGQILFCLDFEFNKGKKVRVTIRQNDNSETIAGQLCKIYSLNEQTYKDIVQIINQQTKNLYSIAENRDLGKKQREF